MKLDPKRFEQQVAKDLSKIDKSLVYRLPDQQSGYYGTSSNICDFIFYRQPNIYFIECKTHRGNTFPLSAFRQYSKMVECVGKQGVRCGVILWMYEHDKIFYIPVSTFTKLINDNKKSFNIKYEGSDIYKSYVIPSEIKRTYRVCDFSLLLDLQEGE